ncbi:hypothetical protein E2C01_061411 [Portunus trituberculatus]|uniref:Uncharacterized protein n=1 Tax=Portunus trituberculatus TaxID=210409 RepID=A0A5B7H3S9_PORTR|nr:hypothetical protein [Portunus trituberculatus]
MAPKRLISDENKESSESASVSEPHPSSSGFMGFTLDGFMDIGGIPAKANKNCNKKRSFEELVPIQNFSFM